MLGSIPFACSEKLVKVNRMMSVSPEPLADENRAPLFASARDPRLILWLMIVLIVGMTGAALWAVHGTRVFVEFVDIALAWCM